MPSAESAASSGIMDSIRSFLASWVAVVKTRVEIISVEIEEQREWMEQLLLLAVAAAFCLAVGMILSHNHPSGSLRPSQADIELTRTMVEAGEVLEVKVLDHMIIGHGRHVSMKRLGLGFSG